MRPPAYTATVTDILQPLEFEGQLRGWMLSCGPLETNAFLLESEGEMVVIDPAIESEALRVRARERASEGVRLIAIWNTHGHFDHVYDNAAWKADFPEAPLVAHAADFFFLEHLREQALWFGLPAPEVVRPDATLQEGQILRVGSLEARVLELPGHSPGSVAFVFRDSASGAFTSDASNVDAPQSEGFVIGGDVLFSGSVGRTDLPGASASELALSIRRLFELSSETRVFPGHGPDTTLGHEKSSNLVARELLARF